MLPDTAEEKCNTESLADDGEGEDIAADVVTAVDDAVLVGAVTAFLPLLTGVVEELPHGYRARYRAQHSDDQPLDAQGQAPHGGVHTAEGGGQRGNVGQECDHHREEE